MEQVPNTFFGLFLGYSAIFLLFGAYLMHLARMLCKLRTRVAALEQQCSNKENKS